MCGIVFALHYMYSTGTSDVGLHVGYSNTMIRPIIRGIPKLIQVNHR